MLGNFFKKKTKKPVEDQKQTRTPIEKPASEWTDWGIYDLLCGIDQGYQPTAAEASTLQSRTGLDLSDSIITALPESFGRLTNLQALDLHHTKLCKLPESFGCLSSLHDLDIFNTDLTTLPESFGQLTSLRVLDLRNTPLTTLPESFGQLTSLRFLDLSNTRLTALPESFGQLTSLQFLSFSNTGLTALPESFGQLTSLQTLMLRNTRLTALPESIGQLTSLLNLDLGYTPLTALPESIGQLTSLQALYLGYTRLTALPESIGQLTSLQALHLRNTALTALPESIGQLTSLQALSLRDTRLTALPEWLGELPKLQRLNLRDLTLPRIPRSLALRGLRFGETDSYGYDGVNLWGVTLTEQDKAIFLQNDPALIAALYEEEDQIVLPECRVIFLGDGDSGKSYTIRRFRNGGRKETAEQPYLTRETPGVEILDQKARHAGKELTLHFWDFGGQQLLHAMHRCFLSEDSCYVVTVKSRETRADQRARYWLRNVTAFAPKSPILLYVNCWDNDNGRRVLDETRLTKDFPMITKVVYVSAKEAEDDVFQKELMNPLIKMAAGCGSCNRTVPRKWKNVRDAIEAESRERDYLTKERYHRLCALKGVENENAPALLSYFNSLGVCFSYHRDENKQELADYRLLKPVWLTNAIYAVIEEGMVYATDGKIRDSAIRQMLCNKAPELVRGKRYRRTAPEILYRSEECPYILDVAILHNLCYRVNDRQLFFPALCSTDSPPEALEEPGEGQRSVEYRMKYSYLPDNVIHRLMICCMQQNFAVKQCWLRGLILADNEGRRVLIRMDDDETLAIDLWFRPEHPAFSVFLWLREEILRINGELGLSARDFIVDGADQYSVISLLNAASKNSTVFGQNSGEERSARELLGNFFESWTIEGMRVENNAIVIPILPYEYHPAKKDDQKLRKALYKAYNGICPYCNKSLPDERSFEVDHIFPSHYQELPELKEYVKYLNDHGFNTAKPDYVENYFPAHHACNLDKSNHTEPFALLAWHHRAARMAPRVLRLMEEQKKTR